MSSYAKANTTTQWYANSHYAGSRINPNCGVLHTTEGTSWPSYGGGATAPNYTAQPDFEAKRLVWRAHFPDEMSARALQNDAGGVNTNTANAVQVELVGTCAPVTRDRWRRAGIKNFIYWPEAPDWALRDLAHFIADMNKRHSIKIDGPKTWLAYPGSYGQSNPNRMTFAQWRNFYGWCGHQHVPENDHGDPGNLPWGTVAAYARDIAAPTPEPAPPAPDVPGLKVPTITWNLGDGLYAPKRDALLKLTDRAKVLGLCEVGDRGPLLANVAAETGFQLLHGEGGGRGKVALLIHPDLPVALDGSYACTEAAYVGPMGAGPSTSAARSIRWAQLENGAVFGVTHKVASVQGKWQPWRERRRAIYRQHVAADIAWAESFKGVPVTLMGDFNATPDFPLMSPIRDRFLLRTAPSHGERSIDYVLIKRGIPRALAAHAVALDGYETSDHKPVLVNLTLPAAALR